MQEKLFKGTLIIPCIRICIERYKAADSGIQEWVSNMDALHRKQVIFVSGLYFLILYVTSAVAVDYAAVVETVTIINCDLLKTGCRDGQDVADM